MIFFLNDMRRVFFLNSKDCLLKRIMTAKVRLNDEINKRANPLFHEWSPRKQLIHLTQNSLYTSNNRNQLQNEHLKAPLPMPNAPDPLQPPTLPPISS